MAEIYVPSIVVDMCWDGKFIIDLFNSYFLPSLVIVFIFLFFRKPILDLAGKVSSVSLGSSNINFDGNKKQNSDASLEKTSISEYHNRNLLVTQNFIKGKLKQTLEKLTLSDSEKIDVLLTDLAGTQISRFFEVTFRNIFKDQIHLLELLSKNSGIPKAAIRDAYDTQKNHEGYAFEDWFEFLVANDLIKVEDRNMVVITFVGRDFLKYLIDQSLVK